MTLLVADALRRRFRSREVVHDLSLRVEPGRVVGLLGPNGAGKTTTFRMLAGLLRPHGGRVRLGDRDISGWPLWRRARAGLGYLPQGATVFRRLTARQNVEVGLRRRGLGRAERRRHADALLERFELTALADQRGDALSGGERRRVEIARALAAEPKVLLVDEPFAGLDPRGTADLARHLRGLAASGVGVLVTDHDVRQTLVACDTAYILDRGSLLRAGEPGRIIEDPEVQRRYLGEGFQLGRIAGTEPARPGTDVRHEG